MRYKWVHTSTVYITFELVVLLKYIIFLIREINKRTKATKLVGKYLNFFEFFYICIVFLSGASRSVTITSFLSGPRVSVWIVTLFITLSLTLGNRFANFLKCNGKFKQ